MMDTTIARKISRLYLLALTALALLSIGGQIWVQRALHNQQNDAKVVNIAGRQRMLSQKICKTVLLLQHNPDSLNAALYLTDLKVDLGLWQQCHVGLSQGYLTLIASRVNNSDTIRALFRDVNPLFQSIFTNAQYFRLHYNAAPGQLQNNIRQILLNERAYLLGMNKIVFQYDTEATQRLEYSQQIEYILLFCTLIVLLLEGLLVFRPAVTQIRQTISLLVDSEKKTRVANAELQETNKMLAETREALLATTRQQHEKEISEQKLRSAYLIEGQEEERKRVALEIHDGLGQMLTALKYGIEKMSDTVSDTTKAQQHLKEVGQLVSQIITEARTISFDLMPAVLNDFGLSSALKLLSTQTSTNTGIPVSFVTNWSVQRFAKNIEIGLYRVAQEAIHNALKYAAATEITVELWLKKKFIHLNITDNGNGFNLENGPDFTSQNGLAHGISNMKARTFIINGEINIVSQPGEGTQIHVKIPLLSLSNE